MKKVGLIFLMLCLFSVYELYAVDTQKQTPILSTGETIINATNGKIKVIVKIKTHKVPINRADDKKLPFIPSTCTYASTCDFVESINISVNGKKIFIPHSVISDLAMLNTAEIRFEGGKMMLLLSEGDASESCFVKIEFNQEHVKSMNVYSGQTMSPDQLLSETKFYLVIKGP